MLLNKKTCPCGEDMREKQFINYVPNRDMTFYGGNVEMIAEHTCECGRVLKGFFKRDERGELQVLDLEVIKDIEETAIEQTEEIEKETEETEATSDMPTEEKVENKPISKAKKK